MDGVDFTGGNRNLFRNAIFLYSFNFGGLFFLDKRRLIYTGKYDLLFDLIKGSISSNRSSDFYLVQKAVVLHLNKD